MNPWLVRWQDRLGFVLCVLVAMIGLLEAAVLARLSVGARKAIKRLLNIQTVTAEGKR